MFSRKPIVFCFILDNIHYLKTKEKKYTDRGSISDTDLDQKRKRAPLSSYIFSDTPAPSKKQQRMFESSVGSSSHMSPPVTEMQPEESDGEKMSTLDTSVIDSEPEIKMKTCHCPCVDSKLFKLIYKLHSYVLLYMLIVIHFVM